MENKEIAITETKPLIWTPVQMFWGTVFGGYLCGFYLLKDNYAALGYPSLAKKAFLAGLISTILLFATIVFIPEESIRQFLLALFLIQGFLAGGYLLYEHYKALYDWNLYKKFFIYLPLTAAALIAIPFYLPAHIIASIPSVMYMITPAVLVQSFAQSYQGEQIKELTQQGATKNSVKKLIGITLLSMLCQLLFVGLFAVIAVILFPES